MEAHLRIDGKMVEYYNAVVDSFGLQFGPQTKVSVLTFLLEEATFTNIDKC
jgi:hypothetical protein